VVWNVRMRNNMCESDIVNRLELNWIPWDCCVTISCESRLR
jgi:hypothetical protein